MIRTLSNTIKQDRVRFKVPRMVQDIIPLTIIWKDGITMEGKGKFSKTWIFCDINYAIASRGDKEGMFLE